MRVLLAALNVPKGEVEANLRGHLEVLDQARREGCDLAVFPEMSLTGSVDPARHPERALPIDAAPVRALTAATGQIGVPVVFGVAERAGAGFHIAQVYAHDGRLGGIYRKRHLGEGEEAFLPGPDPVPRAFQLGSVRFGIAVCAEGGVDFPWDQAAGAGASLMLFCAAPGLYGRRTDQAGWRDGHDWWVTQGLGDAVRHARRLGLWVAMTTQAGAVDDEDFPGLAALVTPRGQVAARLPDWRPSTLVADLPLDVVVRPVREAARALVVDPAGRALLVRFDDDATGASWWAPPGGGLEPGEDHLAAVQRELREEVGRDGMVVGPWIGGRTHTFWLGGSFWPDGRGRWMTQRERWVLCRTEPFALDADLVASLRAEHIRGMRWWSPGELRSAGIETAPRTLPGLLEAIAAGRLPGPDADLGL